MSLVRYYVGKLNSDTILLETNKNSSPNNQPVFIFSTIENSNNPGKDFSNNIVDLSKITLGAYISTENGFCDYSSLDTSYLRKYFDEMASFVPNSEYFRRVIVDGDITMYYSDFLDIKNSRDKNNSRQMVKSNNYGKMYTQDDESAFVQIVFYPVLIITIIAVIAIFSSLF